MKWAALLALTGLVGCGRATPPEEAKAEPAGTPTEITLTAEQIAHGGVRWSAAVATPLADFVELTGRLVVDEDHTARLSPSVKGRVTAVRANLGDAVSRGQALVILQSEEASARRAELARASAELTERQATLSYARAARERAERLLTLKAGSAQDVERARADEAAAEAGVESGAVGGRARPCRIVGARSRRRDRPDPAGVTDCGRGRRVATRSLAPSSMPAPLRSS